MKIAYILTTFPSKTETFAEREIETLIRLGVEVQVLAAQADGDLSKESTHFNISYRPPLFSIAAIQGIWYLIIHYPLGLFKLLGLLVRLLIQVPSEFKTIAGNLHTLGFFVQRLDQQDILYIHAYFLRWPACTHH